MGAWLRHFKNGPDSGASASADGPGAQENSGVSRRPRRDHSAAFKAKVALAALQGDKTESGTIE